MTEHCGIKNYNLSGIKKKFKNQDRPLGDHTQAIKNKFPHVWHGIRKTCPEKYEVSKNPSQNTKNSY
jgi:hypothetical protein